MPSDKELSTVEALQQMGIKGMVRATPHNESAMKAKNEETEANATAMAHQFDIFFGTKTNSKGH